MGVWKAGGGLTGKVRLRMYFLSSNLKQEKKKISWPRKDEEKRISGETITNSYKIPQRWKVAWTFRGKKRYREGIMARKWGCFMGFAKNKIFFTLIMKDY